MRCAASVPNNKSKTTTVLFWHQQVLTLLSAVKGIRVNVGFTDTTLLKRRLTQVLSSARGHNLGPLVPGIHVRRVLPYGLYNVRCSHHATVPASGKQKAQHGG